MDCELNRPLITALTVNFNHSELIELMLHAFQALTFNPYKVIICDNGSNKRHVLRLVDTVKHHKNVEVIFRQQDEERRGSISHGVALDILISLSDTKYTVIMDGDCTFLRKNWDEKLIALLDDKTKIVGTTSPINRAGVRIGAGVFPLPFATLFETQVYKKLNISCTSKDINKGEDTCWEWNIKYAAAGLRGKILITRNTRDYKDGPFGDLTGVEEYYTDDGQLIASHFGRGSSGGRAKYLQWFNLPYVSRVLKTYYGAREKTKWIDKCREIIDRETGDLPQKTRPFRG